MASMLACGPGVTNRYVDFRLSATSTRVQSALLNASPTSLGPLVSDWTPVTPGTAESSADIPRTRSTYVGDSMSPAAARTISGDAGNVLRISRSARTCGSCVEKKKFSSTRGFRSTNVKKRRPMSAVTASATATGKSRSDNFRGEPTP